MEQLVGKRVRVRTSRFSVSGKLHKADRQYAVYVNLGGEESAYVYFYKSDVQSIISTSLIILKEAKA